jgi:hypothetical protein
LEDQLPRAPRAPQPSGVTRKQQGRGMIAAYLDLHAAESLRSAFHEALSLAPERGRIGTEMAAAKLSLAEIE